MSEHLEVLRPKPLDPRWGEIILNGRVVYAGYGDNEELIKEAEKELEK